MGGARWNNLFVKLRLLIPFTYNFYKRKNFVPKHEVKRTIEKLQATKTLGYDGLSVIAVFYTHLLCSRVLTRFSFHN